MIKNKGVTMYGQEDIHYLNELDRKITQEHELLIKRIRSGNYHADEE